MKNIKKSYLSVVGLVAVVFVVNIVAMRNLTPQQIEKVNLITKRKTQYFIHEQDNPANGIWVDKKLVKDNSQSIKNMVEDLGEEPIEISLPWSLETIKLGFGLLRKLGFGLLSAGTMTVSLSTSLSSSVIPVDINDLSPEQLIDVVNLFNFLDVPADKMQAVLAAIKKEIVDKNGATIVTALKNLNHDLQKLIMANPIINCLKDSIIKKYAEDRRKSLIGHLNSVGSVALSSDGTKIVSGCWGSQNNLIVWDISDPQSITHQVLVGHPDSIESVALSPDGTKIVSGCLGNQDNLIVWDISNPQNITHQALVGHPNSVWAVALSSDGTKIVSGSWDNQNNLIVWDINNLQNITHKVLVGHPDRVWAVALSSDGTKIVSGCLGDQNNLIVWDISNPQSITHQVLVGHPDSIESVALSSDGTKIVSGCLGNQDNLIVWDISNPQNITHQALVGHPNSVWAVALSPDGTKIISGCDGNQSNLILWDINNLQNITHKVLVGHPDSVYAAALSSDGTKIISGCDGNQSNLILRDINNLQNITHKVLVGHPDSVYAAALSSDGTKIVSGGRGNQDNLILWTLITDQEEALLNQIKNYTADQIRLIYQLCLQSSKKQSIELKKDSEEEAIFKTLPDDMQKLLTDLFLPQPQGWFSGWWK